MMKTIAKLAVVHFAYFPIAEIGYTLGIHTIPERYLSALIIAAGLFAYLGLEGLYELKTHPCKKR